MIINNNKNKGEKRRKTKSKRLRIELTGSRYDSKITVVIHPLITVVKKVSLMKACIDEGFLLRELIAKNVIVIRSSMIILISCFVSYYYYILFFFHLVFCLLSVSIILRSDVVDKGRSILSPFSLPFFCPIPSPPLLFFY